MNIVKEIVEIEWDMFQKVKNIGGRASCQDNYKIFEIMRASQLESWTYNILNSYKNDLYNAINNDRNLITEKYARMMEYTHSDEYQLIKDRLTLLSNEIYEIVDKIMLINKKEVEKFSVQYPYLRKGGRKENDSSTSIDVYLKGELLTYSENTLRLLYDYMKKLNENGESLAEKINYNMVKRYGYKSLDDAEKYLELQNKGI